MEKIPARLQADALERRQLRRKLDQVHAAGLPKKEICVRHRPGPAAVIAGARRHLAGYRYRNHQKPRSAAGTARLHEFRIRHAAAHRDRRQRKRSRMDRRVLEIHEQKTVHPLERPVEQNPEHGHNLAHSEKAGRKTGQHVPDLRRLPAHLPERLLLPERLQNRKNHDNGQHVLHPPLRRFVEVIRPGGRNGGTETAAGTGFCKF